MGQFIADRDLVPDWIASSTARRAKMTAELFAEHCDGFDELNMDWVDDFYHAPPSSYLEYLDAISPEADERLQTVMVVGHNPGLERLVYQLSRQFQTMPTAAIAYFIFDRERWSGISPEHAELQAIWRPKEIDWD